jgi:hypothetical protein
LLLIAVELLAPLAQGQRWHGLPLLTSLQQQLAQMLAQMLAG